MNSQLSTLEAIMLDELSKQLKREKIKCYTGDKMLLFETNTFRKLIHRVEVDEDTESYILTLTSPSKRETNQLQFENIDEISQYIKTLQN